MIRTIVFFVFVGAVTLGIGWLVDRPGTVEVVWLNHRISTSVAVLVAAIAVLAALSIWLWWLVKTVWRTPHHLKHSRHRRRHAKGQHAIAHGLIAIGAGDAKAAARYAADAQRHAQNDPLALLLRAQSAQLSGDRSAAQDLFGVMAGRSDTKLLGLHGLFVEAQRRHDQAAARALAEEAAQAAPALSWAGHAVLEFRSADHDWAGALSALERNKATGLVDKSAYQRQRAVLLTAQALALADSDRDGARAAAFEAVKLAPDLVPAAALAGRFLADTSDVRKATRMLEAAWRDHPHPDLAEAYMNVRPGDTARERLARIQKLIKQSSGGAEGALALARAAIDAQAYDVARAALVPLIPTPTQRVALLMAELEEAESGDVGRARSWMVRAVHAARDPAWTADGVVSDTWMAVSPMSGRLDAFQWKVPVAELAGPVIDASSTDSVEVPVSDAALEVAAPAADGDGQPQQGTPALSSSTAPKPGPAAEARRSDAVVPLVHAPDDPGPEHEADIEPAPKADSWPRLRALFR